MQNNEGYVTYNFTWFGCLGVLLFCVAAWCVAVYAGYHAAAWVFG